MTQTTTPISPSASLRPFRSLLVAHSEGDFVECLPRAGAMSKLLHSELVVLGMFPSNQEPASPPEGKRSCVVYGLGQRRTLIQARDFLSIIAGMVEAGRFDLVISPPMEGRTITKMVHRLQVPVLVVKNGTPRAILAAVSLRDHQFSLLARANHMSSRLGASLVLVHNISPRTWINNDEVNSRRERLQIMSKGAPPNTKLLVLQNADAVSALLSCTSEKLEALIIVGTRPKWPDDHNPFDIAAQLVEKAPGDVLVTPLTS
jgi:hypothetical protein